MEVNRKDLYPYIKEDLVGEYTIGMHGVTPSKMALYERMTSVKNALDNIKNTGLSINNARTVAGTVYFLGRIDVPRDQKSVKEGLENYHYGSANQVIVAVPSVFRTENGEELYLGTANEKSAYRNLMGLQGNQLTSLLEVVLSTDRLPSEFIYGYYQKDSLESDQYDLVTNMNHVSKNFGFVSEETMRAAKEKIRNIHPELLTILQTPPNKVDRKRIKELMHKISKEIGHSFFVPDKKLAAALETLSQYEEEANIHDYNELQRMLRELEEEDVLLSEKVY